MAKKNRTYVIEVTSTHRYGLNQDYYFRSEKEAKRELAELQEWFKGSPDQKFEITDHILTG